MSCKDYVFWIQIPYRVYNLQIVSPTLWVVLSYVINKIGEKLNSILFYYLNTYLWTQIIREITSPKGNARKSVF